jgi:hypothetical protein
VRKPEKVISLGKFDVQVELFVATQTRAKKVEYTISQVEEYTPKSK